MEISIRRDLKAFIFVSNGSRNEGGIEGFTEFFFYSTKEFVCFISFGESGEKVIHYY